VEGEKREIWGRGERKRIIKVGGLGSLERFLSKSYFRLPSQFPIIRLHTYVLPSHPKKQFDNTSFKYCFGVSKAGYWDIYLRARKVEVDTNDPRI
jgi:hypothetical protein